MTSAIVASQYNSVVSIDRVRPVLDLGLHDAGRAGQLFLELVDTAVADIPAVVVVGRVRVRVWRQRLGAVSLHVGHAIDRIQEARSRLRPIRLEYHRVWRHIWTVHVSKDSES